MGHQSRKCDFNRHVRGYSLFWGEGDCYHCGEGHNLVQCPKIRGACYGCGRRDHTKEQCPSKQEINWEERILRDKHTGNLIHDFQTQVSQKGSMIGGEVQQEKGEEIPEGVRIQDGRKSIQMSYSQAVRAEGGPGIEDGGGGQPVKEGGQVVVSYEERANGRNQGEGMSLEEGEEEQERTLQVRSLEQLWKGKQYQNIHNQADTNRFATV